MNASVIKSRKSFTHTSAPWREQREFDNEAFYLVDEFNRTILIIPGKEYEDTYVKNKKERFANLSLVKTSPLLLSFIQSVVKELKEGSYVGNHVQTMIKEGEDLIKKATYNPLTMKAKADEKKPFNMPASM